MNTDFITGTYTISSVPVNVPKTGNINFQLLLKTEARSDGRGIAFYITMLLNPKIYQRPPFNQDYSHYEEYTFEEGEDAQDIDIHISFFSAFGSMRLTGDLKLLETDNYYIHYLDLDCRTEYSIASGAFGFPVGKYLSSAVDGPVMMVKK